MSQNKTSKYFKYATGEIVLVVIGILIALQINNWNENRKDRALEIKYLKRIKSELVQDSVSIFNAIQTNLKRKERGQYLLELSKNSSDPIKNPTFFIESIEYAGYTHSPAQIDHTYEEIKSAGQLSLLINEDLKTQISTYYAYVENRSQYRFITEQIQLKYLDYRVGILSDEQQIQMGNYSDRIKYSVSDANEVLSRMRSNKKFIEILPLVIQSKTRTHDILDQRLKRVKKLIASIDKELKHRE